MIADLVADRAPRPGYNPRRPLEREARPHGSGDVGVGRWPVQRGRKAGRVGGSRAGQRAERLRRRWDRQVSVSKRACARLAAHDARPWVVLDIQHGRAQHVRAVARQSEVCARDLRLTFVRQPKRIGQEGVSRVLRSVWSTFLASTTHGVEIALERPARPAADGQTGARARSSPHLSVSTPGGRASSERSSTTPTQRLSTSGQAGGSGWRSTDRSPFEALK